MANFQSVLPVLSAQHILGSNPATDKVSVLRAGAATDRVIFRGLADNGFAADMNSMAVSLKFEGQATNNETSDVLTNWCGTGANNASVGTTAWTNPTNVQGNTPGTKATCSLPASTDTNYIWCTNFGLSIPATATVKGISVVASVSGGTPTAPCIDRLTFLIKGGVVAGSDQAGNTWPNTPTIGDITWGSPANLWGATLTPADVNASNFGVAFSARNTNAGVTSITPDIHTVSMTVYFTLPVDYKWQIKPRGQAWEDIDGAADTGVLFRSHEMTEYGHDILLSASDLTNNDFPAEIQLLQTTVAGSYLTDISANNTINLVGESVAGSGNTPFDWSQYIKSAEIIGGAASDEVISIVNDPADELIYFGYVDPNSGNPVTIEQLEFNSKVNARVDAGSFSTTFKWQIRPVGETTWGTAITVVKTVTNIAEDHGSYHEDRIPSDFSAASWAGGLVKGPFEYRLVYSATTGGDRTFTFVTAEADNDVRIRGTIDP